MTATAQKLPEAPWAELIERRLGSLEDVIALVQRAIPEVGKPGGSTISSTILTSGCIRLDSATRQAEPDLKGFQEVAQ
ncbi:hypothetical protein ACL7TT_01260 [Microbulbifer sp. 2304DJ12-6]|uniref:hypothetical protein n=1 Tax=Microbulbifer sp. 2304DJ12-6 TaxID=3233340 RepID=UPI0039AFC1E0